MRALIYEQGFRKLFEALLRFGAAKYSVKFREAGLIGSADILDVCWPYEIIGWTKKTAGDSDEMT